MLQFQKFYTTPGQVVDWTKYYHNDKKKKKKAKDDDYEPPNPEEEEEEDASPDSLDDFEESGSPKKKKLGIGRKITRQHLAKTRDRVALLESVPRDSEGPRRAVEEARKKLGMDPKKKNRKFSPKVYWEFVKNIGKESASENLPSPIPSDMNIRMKVFKGFQSKLGGDSYYFNYKFRQENFHENFFLPPDEDKSKFPPKVYHRWLTSEEKKKFDPSKWIMKVPCLYYDSEMSKALTEEDIRRVVRVRSYDCTETEVVPNPHKIRIHSFLKMNGDYYEDFLVSSGGREFPEEKMEAFLKSVKSSVLKDKILQCLQSGFHRDLYTRLCAAANDPSELPTGRSQVERLTKKAKRELREKGGKVGPHGDPLGPQTGNEAEVTRDTLNFLLETSPFSNFILKFSRERLEFEEIATDCWVVGNKDAFEMMGWLAESGGLEVSNKAVKLFNGKRELKSR